MSELVPLISVCSIVYQHELFIDKMIHGVLSQQTEYDFELIIADDNSKDNTEAIVKRYQEDVRLHFFKNERNLGAIPNFINVLKKARGKYILFCEGDDFWNDPKKIQIQIDFLEKKPNYVACFHPVNIVDSNNKLVRANKSSAIYNRDVSSKELFKGFTLSLSSLCFRNVIDDYPEEFYKTNLGDKFLCSLLGHYGGAKFLPDIKPSSYRMHAGGVWSEKSALDKEKAFINSHYWMWKYYERIGNEELSNHFFKLILKKGYLSSPFNKKGYTLMDKFQYLSLWVLRRIFKVLRYIFRS